MSGAWLLDAYDPARLDERAVVALERIDNPLVDHVVARAMQEPDLVVREIADGVDAVVECELTRECRELCDRDLIAAAHAASERVAQ